MTPEEREAANEKARQKRAKTGPPTEEQRAANRERMRKHREKKKAESGASSGKAGAPRIIYDESEVIYVRTNSGERQLHKYPFPETASNLMTDEERNNFMKVRDSVKKKMKYKHDVEVREQVKKNSSITRERINADDERKEERRMYQRKYMKLYNENMREMHPDKMKEMYARANLKRYQKDRELLLYVNNEVSMERAEEVVAAARCSSVKVCPVCKEAHKSRVSIFCREHRLQIKKIQRYEQETLETLCSWGYYPSIENAKGPCGDVLNMRRADFVFHDNEMDYVVILEVDEDWHKGYPLRCEISRLSDLMDQYPGKHLYIIRYAVKRRHSSYHDSEDCITSASKKKLQSALKMAFSAKMDPSNTRGYKIVYVDYPEERIQDLDDKEKEMQIEAMVFFEHEKNKAFKERKCLEKQTQRERSAETSK